MAADLPSAIYVAGCTGVGKSGTALTLAEQLGGEIISVDSMQVYRGMDIGTDKASVAERARVPHHLLDVCEVRVPFDAAQFVELARKSVAEIQARGRVPVFCGGTGLYFKALLFGLGEAPASDPALRAQLEATPLEALLEELRDKDPHTWETIDRRNPRRVYRAVEIIRLTGKPRTQSRASWQEATPAHFFVLHRTQADLHARIDQRVDSMFARGLVEETRVLLAQGLTANRNAMQALGYRQVVDHLEGRLGLAETIELVKRRTRQFARRQLTYFRGQFTAQWIELPPGEASPASAQRLLELLRPTRDRAV